MQFPFDMVLQQDLKKWSGYLIVTVIGIAFLVLLGWQFDISFLKYFALPPVAMNPVTAVGFILAAVCLLLFKRNASNKLAYILATVVLLIGLLKFGAFLFGFDLQVDSLLYTDKLLASTGGRELNRMPPNTAFCFILAGVSLLMVPYERTHKAYKPSQYFILSIALISLLSILGYLYRVESFHGFFAHIAMAAPSAVCFFLFSLTVFFANPGKGVMKEFTSSLSGGIMARLLIPAAIIVPAILGLLRLQGYWLGIYNNEFGTAIYVLSIIVIFFGVTWYNAYLLNKRDLLRKQTEDALRDSEQHVQAIFNNAPDAIVVIDSKGVVTRWNPEAEHLFGWKEEKVKGRLLTELIIPEYAVAEYQERLEQFVTGQDNVPGKTIDLRAIKKDETTIDISLKISPLVLNEKKLFVGFIRDISEQKQIEDKLKTFNDELSKQVADKTSELTEMFERITDGFIALDQNFSYTYINKKAGKQIRRDPASMIGKNVWEEFPDAVNSSTYIAFNKAIREQRYTTNTDYYPPLDLWQENFIYPSPNGLSVFIRDITEQKKAESEINKARNIADKLIDSLPGVFYFFDAKGKFIRWNREFEKVTGYSTEEIAGMHPLDFFVEEHKNYIAQKIEQVFLEGIDDAEASFLTKGGQKIPYFFKAVLINYEGKPCLLGNGIDIAERKKAVEELMLSEQKYKLLFESNPLSMWMLSLPEYKIIDANSVALFKYGYTKEEFLNLSIADIRPPEDRHNFNAATNTSFRGIYHSGVWRHIKKDGTILYVDIFTQDVYFNGRQTRLVLANDVTEKHIAEEKLKESYEAIRKLTGHLQNVREEERLHISREIHDELGQLLTVLKMDVSWLHKKLEPDNQLFRKKVSEILVLIDATVKSVRRIASELRPTLLDDLGLLAAMEWHLEEFERRSGIKTQLDIPATELQLPDSLKIGLFRIFQESLTNVARHSEAKKVDISLVQNNKQLVLTIKDNGKGFDDKRAVKKTLGLLGMKERTLMMGGLYQISGIIGKGTTVTVNVPLPDTDL